MRKEVWLKFEPLISTLNSNHHISNSGFLARYYLAPEKPKALAKPPSSN
jgi:hypothetical protein